MDNTANRDTQLFRLPTEIRLKIYELIIHSDVDCKILNDILHTSDSNGTQATLVSNGDANLRDCIPWLDLQLTCRDVASELKSFMNESAFLNNPQSRTYVLDFDVHNHPGRRTMRSVTWRRIPCLPSQAQHIVMNVAPRLGPSPWTEGGSASLARALYQILNYLMHCGPKLVTRSLLPGHMSVEDLIIKIDIGSITTSPALGCNTDPMTNYILLQGGWTQISRTGFLSDYIRTTKFRRECDSDIDIPTEWQRMPVLHGYWRGYGFQWGIECAGYRSL